MKAILVILSCAFSFLWAQGGSAAITLVMPPPGDEGFAALQSGAALAEGASAAYYNPAALAELQRSTGSSAGFTRSEQYLLPDLGLSNLRQAFWAADAVVADSAGGADLGVGFFPVPMRIPPGPGPSTSAFSPCPVSPFRRLGRCL